MSAGAKIKGQISGRTEIVIDGEVEGRVEVEASVDVSANGTVNGDIVAKSVTVSGKVLGNVRATREFRAPGLGSDRGRCEGSSRDDRRGCLLQRQCRDDRRPVGSLQPYGRDSL